MLAAVVLLSLSLESITSRLRGWVFCFLQWEVSTGNSDFSLGTGPNRRGILSYLAKLGPKSGAVMAKCHTTLSTLTNVFDGELDAHVHALKVVLDMLKQLGFDFSMVMQADNEPMRAFVVGDANVRTAKHMEIRLWMARDQFRMGRYSFEYVGTDRLTSDINSKPLFSVKFVELRADLMGLHLVPQLLKKFQGVARKVRFS